MNDNAHVGREAQLVLALSQNPQATSETENVWPPRVQHVTSLGHPHLFGVEIRHVWVRFRYMVAWLWFGIQYQQAEGDRVWHAVRPKLECKGGLVESEIDSGGGGDCSHRLTTG